MTAADYVNRRQRPLAVVGACSLLVALSAQQQNLVAGSYETISPSVVQNVLTHQEPDGSWKLDLLVLWRGAPGWFLAGGANGTEESSGTGRATYIHNRHADVDCPMTTMPQDRRRNPAPTPYIDLGRGARSCSRRLGCYSARRAWVGPSRVTARIGK